MNERDTRQCNIYEDVMDRQWHADRWALKAYRSSTHLPAERDASGRRRRGQKSWIGAYLAVDDEFIFALTALMVSSLKSCPSTLLNEAARLRSNGIVCWGRVFIVAGAETGKISDRRRKR